MFSRGLYKRCKSLWSITGYLVNCLHGFNSIKRGLSHAHLLLRLSRADHIHPDSVDNIVCAEIAAKARDVVLYVLVTAGVTHGLCGKQFPNGSMHERWKA